MEQDINDFMIKLNDGLNYSKKFNTLKFTKKFNSILK